MSRLNEKSKDPTIQAILAALHACYGSLVSPDFQKVYETIETPTYQTLVECLLSGGIDIRNTTDLNDDVSLFLALRQTADRAILALSGVGLFAALIHLDSAGRYSWVTEPEGAPSPLTKTVAHIVQRAGFALLDRALVSQTIPMTWYDDSTEVTLYQALFTDTDRIP